MFRYRPLNVEAHYGAPLRIFTLILLTCLLFTKAGFSTFGGFGPPCRVDTTIYYGWCIGDTLQVGGLNYSTPGVYAQFLQTALGCDSVVNLQIHPRPDTPIIGQHPSSIYIGAGDTGSFLASASPASDCRWQTRTGTGVWMNVRADSIHSSPFLSHLSVVATGGSNNAVYRYYCQGCMVDAVSDSAELWVYPQQPPVVVQLPTVESCVGENTPIAVLVNSWQHVGRISLDVILPTSSLQLIQWSARVSGLSLSVQGDTVKIRKATTVSSILTLGDTLLVLVVRPLFTGTFPLTWLVPDSGTVGLQYIDPNSSWVHRLVPVNGHVFVPSLAAQVVQEPMSVSVRSGDSVLFLAACVNAIGYRWQIRVGSSWRSLVETNAYRGTQTAMLYMDAAPDSLNNARFRLIAFGSCGRNDTSQTVDLRVESSSPAIRMTLPQVLACTTGQYSLSLNVESFNQVSAFSLRFTYHPDSIQYMVTEYTHPALGTGYQLLHQSGGLTLNWYGTQPLQLGAAELLRLRFQIAGSSQLQWDTSAQGPMLWTPYQQMLQTAAQDGWVRAGSLSAVVDPIPCLFIGDAPVALSAWPPGGTFSGVGVQSQVLYVDTSPGVRTVHYQAVYQGCPYGGQYTYEVWPAPSLQWNNTRDVCRGTPITLTALRLSNNVWSTGDTSAMVTLHPITDTLVWVRYTSPTGCIRIDSVRLEVRPGPNATVDDSVYYYHNNTTPVLLRAAGGVSYLWQPSSGLSDSTSAAPLAMPDTTTTYTVTVMDSFGCSRTLRVVVLHPRINPMPNRVLCRGDSLTLDAPVLYTHQPTSGPPPTLTPPIPTYLWQPAAGLDDPYSPNPKASPGSTTLYQVRVIVAQNCTLTAHRGVIVLAPPQVEIGHDSIYTSIGHPVRLQAHIWDTTQPVQYQWTPATGLSDSTQQQPFANPMSTTNYKLTVRSANGCISSDSVVVVVSQVGLGAVLQGQLIYDNSSQTPLREGTVTLMPILPHQPFYNNPNRPHSKKRSGRISKKK